MRFLLLVAKVNKSKDESVGPGACFRVSDI